MKFFLPISSFCMALLATAVVFSSCQKEQMTPTTTVAPVDGIIGSRGPGQTMMYGVTTFKSGIPCKLVTMDPVGETVLAAVNVTLNGTLMNDLKGVCCVGQEVYVTTGYNEVDALSNLLLRVNPQTGQAGLISQSTVGTVSDIDYNPFTGEIKGLLNNNNRLVTINGAGFVNYALANFTLPLSAGYTASGLTYVRSSLIDPNLISLKVAAANGTVTTGGPIKYFEVPAAGGVSIFEAVINPINQLGGANCGLGYVSSIANIGRVFINKNGSSDVNTGLNRFDHAIPLFNPTLSIPTGISGFNFEDLSTAL